MAAPEVSTIQNLKLSQLNNIYNRINMNSRNNSKSKLSNTQSNIFLKIGQDLSIEEAKAQKKRQG